MTLVEEIPCRCHVVHGVVQRYSTRCEVPGHAERGRGQQTDAVREGSRAARMDAKPASDPITRLKRVFGS